MDKNKSSKAFMSTVELKCGSTVRIKFLVEPYSTRCNVLLKSNETPLSDLALFVVITKNDLYLASNINGVWRGVVTFQNLKFSFNRTLELKITCSVYNYEISINEQLLANFDQYIPCWLVTHIAICGDFITNIIMFDDKERVLETLVNRNEIISSEENELLKNSKPTIYGSIVIPMCSSKGGECVDYSNVSFPTPLITPLYCQRRKKTFVPWLGLDVSGYSQMADPPRGYKHFIYIFFAITFVIVFLLFYFKDNH